MKELLSVFCLVTFLLGSVSLFAGQEDEPVAKGTQDPPTVLDGSNTSSLHGGGHG